MKKLSGFFGSVLFTILAFKLFAGSVTVSWNPNSETDLAGYKIYYGTQSRNYDKTIDVGNTTSYRITNLSDGLTYYFAVTAYDTANNESDFSEEVFITLAPPEQPPVVAYFQAVDPQTLHLVFNKKMDPQSLKTISNYTISPTIQILSVEIDTSLTVVTIHTDKHQVGKTYTLTVQNVKDLAGNSMENPYSVNYSFKDQTPPFLERISLLNSETIRLYFNEPLDATTVTNTTNYSISPSVSVLNVELDPSLKIVTLHTSSHLYEVEYKLTIHGIADTSGNVINENYIVTYIFTTPPTVVYFHPVDPRSLRLVFSKKMNTQSATTISNYTISPTIQILSVEIDTSLTVVTIHTDKHQVGKTYTLTVQNVKDLAGNSMENPYSVNYSLPDKRPPYVEQLLLLNLEAIQLHFNEPMNASTVRDTSNYLISPPISILSAEVDSSFKVVTLRTAPHLFEVEYKLTIHGVTDSSGNEISENYTITYIFAAPPRITNLNPSYYAPSNVREGDSYYVDREFRISFIPDALKDLIWLKTANNDKFETDPHFLTFSISKSAKVYVGYDSRLENIPAWLESWESTGLEIHDEMGVVFQIYSRHFSRGDVVLGGNNGTDATNMYIVLLKGTDEHIEYPEIPEDPYQTHETAESHLLYQNFPNPFNPNTKIRFYLSKPDTVLLTIHDMLGREIRRYEIQAASSGIFSVNWDGTNKYGQQVASGMYLYCLQGKGNFRQTKKMIRVR